MGWWNEDFKDLGNFLCPEDFSEIKATFLKILMHFQDQGVLLCSRQHFWLYPAFYGRGNLFKITIWGSISHFLSISRAHFFSFGQSPISTEDHRPTSKTPTSHFLLNQYQTLSKIFKNQNHFFINLKIKSTPFIKLHYPYTSTPLKTL